MRFQENKNWNVETNGIAVSNATQVYHPCGLGTLRYVCTQPSNGMASGVRNKAGPMVDISMNNACKERFRPCSTSNQTRCFHIKLAAKFPGFPAPVPAPPRSPSRNTPAARLWHQKLYFFVSRGGRWRGPGTHPGKSGKCRGQGREIQKRHTKSKRYTLSQKNTH